MIVQMSELVTPTFLSDVLMWVVGAIALVGGVAAIGALFSLGREPYRK